jgi:hypothetical protein
MLFALSLYISAALRSDAWSIANFSAPTFSRGGMQRTPKTCRPAKFSTSGEARVYASSYASIISRFRIGDGTQLAAITSVGANPVGPPVLLILAAQNDTIWDFREFPKKRLTGVIVLGGDGQAIANLPSAIPVSFGSAAGPNGQCFNDSMLLPESSHLPVTVIHELVGDLAYRFIEDRDPATINIDGGRPPRPTPDRLQTREIRASKTVTREVPAGIAGIIELMKSGAVRYATQTNADAWTAKRLRMGLPSKPLGLSSTYVITRATGLPENGDAFWPSYIVLPGIPEPKNAQKYFMLGDGSCKGC